MDKLITKFETVSEYGGKVTVCEYQEQIPDGLGGTIRGMSRLATEDGRTVTGGKDNTFTIVSTGETLSPVR